VHLCTEPDCLFGHVISQDGVSTDPAKVSSIANSPTPQNAKELRSFLGLSG
jgi:hypothetical protein